MRVFPRLWLKELERHKREDKKLTLKSLCLTNHIVQKRRIWKTRCVGHRLLLLLLSDVGEVLLDYAVLLQVDDLEVHLVAL